jgi:hypothetical protein
VAEEQSRAKCAKGAKTGDGIKIILQKVTEKTERNQKTSFSLFSPVKRGFLGQQ